MSFGDFMEKKEQLQDTLVTLIVKYCKKYMKKKYLELDADQTGSKRVLRKFQKELTYISSWKDSKIDREYAKFRKWHVSKLEVSEQEIHDTFNNIILLSIQILTNNQHSTNVITTTLSSKDLFFKSIKRIARFYYENPSVIISDEDEDSILRDLIESLIHTFVPLQKIMSQIQEHSQRESFVSYDFNKHNSSTNGNERDEKRLVIEKQKTSSEGHGHGLEYEDHGLRYIGSDEMYNEYYESDDEGVKSKSLKEDDEKHINVPIQKKQFYKRNGK
jgi:hypothetical protein